MPKVTETENLQIYKKNTMRKDIRKYIQNMVTKGIYKPGDRIVETKLAKEMGVSQTPVREALLELVMMGMLEERPYSGTFVKKLTAEEIEDVYNTRAMIEECAIKKATMRITDDQLVNLNKEIDNMKQAASCEDSELFVDADVRFHEIIINSANSPSLKRIWRFLRMADWTYTTTRLTTHSLYDLSCTHELIYTHIKNRDALQAGKSMHMHITSLATEVINGMQKDDNAETTQNG